MAAALACRHQHTASSDLFRHSDLGDRRHNARGDVAKQILDSGHHRQSVARLVDRSLRNKTDWQPLHPKRCALWGLDLDHPAYSRPYRRVRERFGYRGHRSGRHPVVSLIGPAGDRYPRRPFLCCSIDIVGNHTPDQTKRRHQPVNAGTGRQSRANYALRHRIFHRP